MCVGTARRRRQDDVHVAQPFLCAWLVGTVRPDGQEAMVRVNCWQVQPEHSSGAVVKHGSRGASSAGLAAAEAAGEAARRLHVPVVRPGQLKSWDGARRTAGVLPSRAAAKGAPSNVYRRSARCLRALAATPKPARALGPSCIALTGASPSVSCRASV